jgi:phosphate transport system permease protein
MKNKIVQAFGFSLITISIIITLIFLAGIIYLIMSKGLSVISWDFLTSVPRKGMTAGGVAPAIIGTFYLTSGAILFALPLGLACAVYLNEYSPKGFIVNIIRMSINNLAGVPSVVFGLFGLAVFVKFF